MNLLAHLKRFIPGLPPIQPKEQLRAAVGALLGILLTGVLAALIPLGSASSFLMIAPMGATAVLLFTAPASPLAQPWSVIGGNVLSAVVGVAAAQFIPSAAAASAIAVAAAIAGMTLLRCLHPPSAAVALTFVLGGEAVQALGWAFVLNPVALDTVLLLLAAAAYNNLTGHRYPYLPPRAAANAHHTGDPLPSARVGVSSADIDRALRTHDEVLLVSPRELDSVLKRAEAAAFQRRHGEPTCGDIMSRDVASITPDKPLGAAREIMRAHNIRALPVVLHDNKLIGILTMSDLLEHMDAAANGPVLGTLVGQAMTSPVHVVTAETPLSVLVEAMSDRGLHALPVVDPNHILVGIVTQSDLIATAFPTTSARRTALRAVPAANDQRTAGQG